MLQLHAGQGAPDDWGDRFEQSFLQALDDARAARRRGVSPRDREYIHWATREVNAYSPIGARVDPDRAMPHWAWSGLLED
jgi:hypothetical protein